MTIRTELTSKPEIDTWRLKAKGIALRLFFTCWVIYAVHFATNTVRELYPVMSLGDHLSFDVSEYLGLHPDIFAIPGRGAFINNNPGASILGAVPYTLARPVTDRIVRMVENSRRTSGKPVPEYNSIYPMAQEFFQNAYVRGLDVKFGLVAGITQVFLMAPLSALNVVVMFYVLASLTKSRGKAAVLALLYAFATPVFYRTAQLNHNLLQSHFTFFAFVLLWRPWDYPEQTKRPNFLLAGLLAGWTVVLDYSGLVIVLALSVYAWVRWRSLHLPARHAAWFFLGAAASISILLLYQWSNFGNPFYPAQHYMPSTTYSGYGYQGMDWPSLSLLWELAFGMRYGLFTSAPLLLLAIYVPAWFKKSLRLTKNLETWFILAFSAAFFLFTAANQFSRMQFNSGIRHMVPVTPFLFLLAAGVLLKMPSWLSIPLSVITTYWSWCLAMYRDVEQGLGIFESLIHITTGGIRFPWLVTLELMGYVSKGLAVWILLICLFVIGILWLFPSKRWAGMNILRSSARGQLFRTDEGRS